MVDRIVRRKRYAVVVTTYGEVDKLTIRNLWPSSRRILRVVTRQIVKVPTALIYFIADYRSTKHYIKWKLHRYRSSLIAINRAQTKTLDRALKASGSEFLAEADVRVVDAYYFVPPYLDEMIEAMRTEYDGIVVVPMIPVESSFSCGVACQMVMDVCGENTFALVKVMSKLWSDDALHRIYIDHLFSGLSGDVRTMKGRGKIGLVLVIHGTLVKDRHGNTPKVFTGLEETIAFFDAMKQKIMGDARNLFSDVRQGCINHSNGGEWTSDTIEKALSEYKEEGYEAVVMFPYGFFADNSETEYDANLLLEKARFPVAQYLRCINDSPAFGHWLAEKVLKELQWLEDLQEMYERLEKRPVEPKL
ncbi:MAG: ferrochelatase [Chlorobiaceae bacterium]|nr:ferrochelatase [Chlorobiaceae bacterium]